MSAERVYGIAWPSHHAGMVSLDEEIAQTFAANNPDLIVYDAEEVA